jgi:uncharacterized protein
MSKKFSLRGIGLCVAFLVLAVALLAGSALGLHALGVHFHDPKSPVERPIAIAGTWLALALTLLATWIMARIEGRSWLDFGLRGGPRAPRQFASGILIGLGSMIGIALVLHFAGGMNIRSADLSARAAGFGLLWAIGFFGTGLFEETLFRGYLLKRLGEATPFPVAIVATSLLFGLAHLSSGFDAGLALVDAVLVGGILAISIQLTGSLWWAIGFHAAWDWVESYVLGAADSGLRAEGALFHADPAGPVWLSGGASGPEGSLLTFAVGLIALVLLARRTRRAG